MNRSEAYRLLVEELDAYCGLPFAELHALVGDAAETTRHDADGVGYLIEVSVRRSDSDDDTVIVAGSAVPSAWGGPHDRVAEELAVRRQEVDGSG